MLLREITGNYDIKAVVFDGVRAEESAARAKREEISVGAKNINQINCSPILKWSTAELFIYLLHRDNKKDKFRQLCPLHPMTLSMLAIVAQNFGASQRTLFRFMKDRKESAKNVGFIYYINNFGYDNWRWLTTDFLWDYFFMRESDVKNFSTEAKSAYQHFVNKKEFISDDYHMHVFKAAMLLIAVMSSGNVSNLA